MGGKKTQKGQSNLGKKGGTGGINLLTSDYTTKTLWYRHKSNPGVLTSWDFAF